MNFQQRTERIRSYSLVVLVLLSLISASFFALLPTKAKALENNDNLPISQQHARTLLYALERCVDKHLNSMPTASEVNAVDVFNNQSSDGVSIGYEIDTDNGARQCNNLDYSKALGFIDMDASDIRNMYTCNNGTCSLKGGSKDSLLTRMRQKMRERAHSGGRVYGPKERARRLAVTLSRCIEPLGDGLHPERGSLITIDGSRFQLRDGMSMKDKISAGIDMEPVDGKYECETLINLARNENVLDSLPDGVTLASLFSNPNAISGEGDAAGGDATEVEKSCESEGGNMSWILCSVLGIADQVVKVLDRTLTRILLVPNAFLEDEGLKRAWSRLRNLAYIILIPIVLVMVIGTALGFDFVSAYTVKRAMPRLLIATIFIALSFDISRFLVELTNVVGVGIYGMITSAFTSDPITLESIFAPAPGQGAVSLGLTLALGFGALAVGSIGIILSYMLVTLVGLAIGFFLLSLRQILIVALMILAPVAILAWIFPGNDKLWKLWWGTFSKLLMLFPLVMILIAAGRSFAYTIHEVRADDEWPLMISTLMKLVAYVGPFFFIPALFKFAGGAFATIAGITNDKGRGIFDRNKKYRQQKYGQNWSDTKAGKRYSGTGAVSQFANRNLQRMSHANKMGLKGLVSPRTARARIATATSGASMAAMQEDLEKNLEFAQIKNDDDLLSAGIRGGSEADVRSFLEQRGRQTGRVFNEQDVQAVMAARRSLGNNFNGAAIISKAGTGTGYAGREGSGEMVQDIIDAAGGDRNKEAALFAAAKSSASSARRYDLGGIGFGEFFTQREALRTADPANRAAVLTSASDAMIDSSLDSQGAGAVLAGRAQSVDGFVPALQRRMQRAWNNLQDAHASGDTTRIDAAQREFTQHVASTEALIDTAGQASPEAARTLADYIHSAELPIDTLPATARDWIATRPDGTRSTAPTMTMRQMMDHLGARGGDYDEMRRNYGSSYQRELAQQQATMQGPAQGPAQGPGTGII